ncbi:hypothetical protein [Amycolatopsis sp. NPDC059021]|uniref:hypothetical protein n=1 Tax=Amycolatopsis sp. NPDC059021 TaxID=3346704 RepID=UPI00366B1784
MTDAAHHLLDDEVDFDDFELWTARLALRVLLDEALADFEIMRALAEEQVPAEVVSAAVLADESVLTRIRVTQDRLFREGRHGAVPRSTIPALPRFAWSALVVALGGGYLSLLLLAWPKLPLPWQIFSVVGFFAVIVLSARIVVGRVPSLLGLPAEEELGRAQPDPRQLGLGDQREFVLAEIVLPAVREFVRSQRTVRYGSKLVYTEISGLYEEDGSKIVLTSAARRLRRVIERADSGAVALAGSRGVGKTTAIRAMQRGLLNSSTSSSPLVVLASAPAHYEARDFVLHLHALLCNAVIDTVSEVLGPLLPRRREDRAQWVRNGLRGVAGFLGFAALCLVPAFFLWNSTLIGFPAEAGRVFTAAAADLPGSARALWADQPMTRIIALGLIVLFAARTLWVVLRVPASLILLYRRRRRHRELFDLLRTARKHLVRTRFLQTHTTGWSGKLSLPFKGEAGRTWSTQRAEQQLTHPEVVDKLREFAEKSARVLREEGVTDRMVIAIDELDKIGEQEKAHQFVNDVKGVFGVPGCLFFVSVSDDAVLNFEQRGLGVRDAFDSAFAEMVRLEHFTLDESRMWVALRLQGVPDQFCYLCHCLSGGLPRDLRRYTTDIVDVTAEVYQPWLSHVADKLVRTELTSKMHALSGTVTTLEDAGEHVGLIAELLAIPETANPLELAELADQLVRGVDGPSSSPVNTLRWHGGCFVLFSATILEVFDDDLDETGLTPDLHQLALVRRQLALHPQLAWRRLLDFRKAAGLHG